MSEQAGFNIFVSHLLAPTVAIDEHISGHWNFVADVSVSVSDITSSLLLSQINT